MALKSSNAHSAFIEDLRQLSQNTPLQPFTTKEVEQILVRHGTPKDLSRYENPKLVPLLKQLHIEQLARAEANFRAPERMHTLGELFNSTLILTGLFISQLAEQIDLSVAEIDDYIEHRSLRPPLSEKQIVRLTEVTGIALVEIRRIAAETATREQPNEDSVRTQSAASKPGRTYSTDYNRSGMGIIRDTDD